MSEENTKLIKKFNIKIGENASETYEVGADAKNVKFSDNATSPFTDESVENNTLDTVDVPKEIVSKAENRIYGNAYIKNNDKNNIEGTPPDNFGPTDDIQIDNTVAGAGAMSITYGFNSLAAHHHSMAIGFDCVARGWASHAEGWKTNTGSGSNCAHAEGAKSNALHNMAHAEGNATTANGSESHSEGRGTSVYGVASHVEGIGSSVSATVAYDNSNAVHGGDISTEEAKGKNNDISLEVTDPKQFINGQASHAEGFHNVIYGACCHAEGMNNTINQVYASTVMGDTNNVGANKAVAMGSNNNITQGADNSLVIGEGNRNPGYPHALVTGRYAAIGDAMQGSPPALVIGAGSADQNSNLISLRFPGGNGIATNENRGVMWAKNIDAHFYRVNHYKKIPLSVYPLAHDTTATQYNRWNLSYYNFDPSDWAGISHKVYNTGSSNHYLHSTDGSVVSAIVIHVYLKDTDFKQNADMNLFDCSDIELVFVSKDKKTRYVCRANQITSNRVDGELIASIFVFQDDYLFKKGVSATYDWFWQEVIQNCVNDSNTPIEDTLSEVYAMVSYKGYLGE